MESQWHQNIRDAVTDKPEEGKLNLKQDRKEDLPAKQQVPTITSPASPPSASCSPSHEFSFTISLHPSSALVVPADNKTKAPPPSLAIDMSPADDIFFHGHLLPLHLVSHLPVSPRSSTNSLDSFTLPIRELSDDQGTAKSSNNCSRSNIKSNTFSVSNKSRHQESSNNIRTTGRAKSKSFSLFAWRKGCEERGKVDTEKHKKRLSFDLSHILKRYARLVRPLSFFRRRQDDLQFQRQPYSFSGNLDSSNKQELRGRRGQLSAPASMRTSPTNSGLLVATTTLPSSTSDSTMEELQAAIQAAIAHCKNSIAAEENIK